MISWLLIPLQILHVVTLRCAAMLLPRQQRREWLREWQSELWHVRQACVPSRTISWQGERDITTFCFGAFQDAFCERRHVLPGRVFGSTASRSAAQCTLSLIALAAASYYLALSLPGVHSALQPSPYRDARHLMLISDAKYAEASFGSFPTIRADQFRAWKDQRQHLFTGFAFYETISNSVHIASHQTEKLSIIHSTSNLFDILGLPAQFSPHMSESHSTMPTVVLTEQTRQRYFGSYANIVGCVVEVGLRKAMVISVVPDGTWRLPGRADAWLLEPDEAAIAIPSVAKGFLIASLAPPSGHARFGGYWHMSARTIDGTFGNFACLSLAERMQEPFNIFIFTVVIAFLALPATTSLPLGEYPSTDHNLFWPTRFRRWIFLCCKVFLILPTVYFGSLDMAHLGASIDPVSSQYIQIIASFSGCLFALRWALRDQRKRCPVCLRKLTNPARVGEPSRNFLAWNGTELICVEGHGLLHVPEIPTSWFSTQRWLYLDTSWEVLFSETQLARDTY